jgi:metallo-beta-lactamase family protein|tara:strand:+ start:5331 stop:6695 length:1365 start_codon:yes stop_codon:yes gene_type:complete
MKLHFYGGARVVTGSNYLLETSKTRTLIDCGLFQGSRDMNRKNSEPFPYQPNKIDFVLITHAHLDHIGRLPKLINDGFNGKIFATAPTIGFARLMLEDSQKILNEKLRKADVIPLMDGKQIEKIMKMFQSVEYDQPVKLNQEISVCFREAGHVLGSAVIEVTTAGKKIVFSGDLGAGRMPILRKPAVIKQADYVIMESTYGNRLHESVQDSKDTIEDVAEETIAQGGVLMIPSFALERTQQLLYHFNELIENHRIPEVPIFVDSPLAIKLTKIYEQYPQYYNKQTDLLIKSGDDVFKFPGLKFTLSVKESKAINEVAAPKIIIAGSGMSQGGRIIHHEVRYLPDPKNTLLIVTYQAHGTLGRKILEGADKVRILNQIVSIKAKIRHINGYSAHADQKDLINWLTAIVESDYSKRPQKVFICQGEEKPAQVLAQKIKDHLGLVAEVPELNQAVEL